MVCIFWTLVVDKLRDRLKYSHHGRLFNCAQNRRIFAVYEHGLGIQFMQSERSSRLFSRTKSMQRVDVENKKRPFYHQIRLGIQWHFLSTGVTEAQQKEIPQFLGLVPDNNWQIIVANESGKLNIQNPFLKLWRTVFCFDVNNTDLRHNSSVLLESLGTPSEC